VGGAITGKEEGGGKVSAAAAAPRGFPSNFSAVVAPVVLREFRSGCVYFGSVAEWLACWTQSQKGPGSNLSRDAVG